LTEEEAKKAALYRWAKENVLYSNDKTYVYLTITINHQKSKKLSKRSSNFVLSIVKLNQEQTQPIKMVGNSARIKKWLKLLEQLESKSLKNSGKMY